MASLKPMISDRINPMRISLRREPIDGFVETRSTVPLKNFFSLRREPIDGFVETLFAPVVESHKPSLRREPIDGFVETLGGWGLNLTNLRSAPGANRWLR